VPGFAVLDRATVIDALRGTGSRDPDVLHAQKLALLESARGPRILGTTLLWAGVIAILTVVLAPVGVPLLLVGWWLRRRGAQNVAVVEAGFAEFLGTASRPGPRPI
jgi:hypothetical protein